MNGRTYFERYLILGIICVLSMIQVNTKFLCNERQILYL